MENHIMIVKPHAVFKIINQNFYLLCFTFFIFIEVVKRIMRLCFYKWGILKSLFDMYTTFTATSCTVSTIYYYFAFRKYKVDNLFVAVLMLSFVVTFIHWIVFKGIFHFFHKGLYGMGGDIATHILNLGLPLYDYFFIRKGEIVTYWSLIYACGVMVFYSAYVHMFFVEGWINEYPYVGGKSRWKLLRLGIIVIPILFIIWIFLYKLHK